MKYLNRLLAGALLVGMTACSSDEPNPGTGGGSESSEPLYSTITIAYPGSRSGEANEGEEVGKDVENTVSSVFVVLATSDDNGKTFKFLTSAENDSKLNSSNKHIIVFSNKKALIDRAEGATDEDRKVYVFAYCNPTPEFTAAVKAIEAGTDTATDFTQLVCSANVEGSWAPNYFLMTNIGINSVVLDPTEELKKHNSVSNPFDLGKIEVVRTASRFDFKDASDYKDADENKVPFTYAITDYRDPAKEIATVTFDKMAVFNQRNDFYYLARTKAEATTTDATLCPGWVGMSFDKGTDGTWTNPFVVCPADTTYAKRLDNGYIIDPDKEPSALNWKSLSDICKTGNEDNDKDWNNPAADDKNGYYIFDYTTENAVVADLQDGQTINGANLPYRATGVVFRAEIKVKEDKNIVNGEAQTMYVYDNTLYYNAKEIYDQVQVSGNAPIKAAFEACFDVTGEGDAIVVTEKEGADLRNHKFIAYRPCAKEGADKGKYFCYYIYYNQHVDDNDASATGKMEYATVRNNIYKLAVNKVTKLGTSEITEVGDWDIYFQVEVELRNWVVRVNSNIEF